LQQDIARLEKKAIRDDNLRQLTKIEDRIEKEGINAELRAQLDQAKAAVAKDKAEARSEDDGVDREKEARRAQLKARIAQIERKEKEEQAKLTQIVKEQQEINFGTPAKQIDEQVQKDLALRK